MPTSLKKQRIEKKGRKKSGRCLVITDAQLRHKADFWQNRIEHPRIQTSEMKG